jgi:hypothetical protein
LKNGATHPDTIDHWNATMISRRPDTGKKARFLHFLKEAGGEVGKIFGPILISEFDEGGA